MHYVEEVHQLVGAATTCWREDGTFNESEALKIASRLCDMIRQREDLIAEQSAGLFFVSGAGLSIAPRKPRRRKTKE